MVLYLDCLDHIKGVKVQSLNAKKSSKKTKQILKKSFREIIKNGLEIYLDYHLLFMRKFMNTWSLVKALIMNFKE